ncbi:phage tail protein [Kluyvera sichuanensis]|uniref:phage tail protein n=1 Tax=Kluyvera sichuanensis TaxID=2725494 RepID=UPI003F6742D2
MTTKYFAILTNQGAARLANATMLGTKLNITQMAVGDGNGTLPTPDPAQTKLINQTRIAPINSLSVDANDAGQIIAEQIIPENEGGFFIREIGLYDDDGILIAVANCPETYKPLLAEGSGRTQTIRMILVVSSTSAITLKIDPSVVLATRKYVDDAVIEVKSYADGLMRNHEQSRNHPDATTTAKGFTQLNSSVTDDRETQSATPKAVKIAMDNANARLAKERNLADLPNPALARQNLQLGDSSTKNTGTTANTVAAGDDARITGAMQKSQNGADIPDVAKFLQNLGLRASGQYTDNLLFTGPDGLKIQVFRRTLANKTTVGVINTVPVTFPVPFPVNCWGVFSTKSTWVQITNSCEWVSNTGFTAQVMMNIAVDTNTSDAMFLAIGY